MAKYKENQFYCVSCRAKITAHPDDMGVKTFKNPKMKGGTPALRSVCHVCGTNLTKWIPHAKKESLTNKYGKF